MTYLKAIQKNNKLYLDGTVINFIDNVGYSEPIKEGYPLNCGKQLNGSIVLGFCGFETTTQLRKLEKIPKNCKKFFKSQGVGMSKIKEEIIFIYFN